MPKKNIFKVRHVSYRVNTKHNFCPGCGTKTREDSPFCSNCGYKIVVTDVIEDKEGHIKKVEEIMQAESMVDAPPKLSLMPGEKLLVRHMDIYISNKRLIKHTQKLLHTSTKDFHYSHINLDSGNPKFQRKYFLSAIGGGIFK